MTRKSEPHESNRDATGMGRIPNVFGRQNADSSFGQSAQCRHPFSRVRPLVVPLDGSDSAEHALPHALAIARRNGAAVLLVHVQSPTKPRTPWRQHYDNIQLDELRKQKQQYMRSVLIRIRRLVDVQVTGIVIESINIATSLRDIAAGAALVVMATPGQGPVRRLLRGSVTDKVIQSLSCPVLVVRGDHSQVNLSIDPMPQHILFALDGTVATEAVLDSVACLGSISNAQFTLAHFQDDDPRVSDRFFEEAEIVRRYLLDAARRIKERWPKARTFLESRNEQIASALLPLAQQREVDLVAIAIGANSGFLGLFKGPIATAMACSATTPVLVCRRSNDDPTLPLATAEQSLVDRMRVFALRVLDDLVYVTKKYLRYWR